MIYGILGIVAILAIVVTALGGVTAVEAEITGPEMDSQPDQYIVQQWPPDVVAFGQAVAIAENSPSTYNNPLDLRIPGWVGPTFGSRSLSVFQSLDEGWHRGFYQIWLIGNAVNGRTPASKAGYSASDTILTCAERYTGNDNAAGWAQTVADALGVGDVNTPLNQVLL